MSDRPAERSASRSLGDLLDVNVWLALAIAEHPHHAAAAAYWTGEAAAARFFCRTSAMSMVRLLMHPRLMAERPLSMAKAWAAYRGFATLPGVAMLAEPDGLDADLHGLVGGRLPARLFTDAYFAAFARLAQVRLVTFDKDFARFEPLTMLRLTNAAVTQ